MLKEDGTLTFTDEKGKEFLGYWFMKDTNTLCLSLSKNYYLELTKK